MVMKASELSAAIEAMRKAGVFEIVKTDLDESRFTVAEFLALDRTPRRLVMVRHVIWRKVYERKEAGRRLYSFPELARLFNRESHTSIMAGVRSAT